MTTSPLMLIALIGVAVYVARLWVADYRAAVAGRPRGGAFPGATPAPAATIAIASLGALLIVAGETAGELALGLGHEQSRVTALFGAYSVLGAPVLEELLFRGYLVYERRGRAALWAVVVGVSLLFALLHPYVWAWSGQSVTLRLDAKAWFSTTTIFVASLWLYAMRFFGLNPRRSLLPCFAAHASQNAGVLAIKFAQGFAGTWW